MFKVHSFFPNKSPSKEASIQTQLVFPNIQKEGRLLGPSQQMSKSFMQQITPNHSFAASVVKMYGRTSESIFKATHRQKLLKIGTVETKNFKFLELNEKKSFRIIDNYLKGKTVSKEDSKLLYKKMSLPYLKIEEDILSQGINTSKKLSSELPQGHYIQTTLKEVIDLVRELYQGKPTQKVEQNLGLKNITLTVQRILYEQKYQQIEGSSNENQLSTLRQYLNKCIEDIEKQKVKCKFGDKKFLLKFYQEVYNRYQRIPFSDSTTTEVLSLVQPQGGKQNELVPPEIPKCRQPRKKATVNQSFIKMRFYNNLKQEVQTLSDNTEKILNEEMNRLNHM